MGTYTHIANSSHIYERHFEVANKMITSKFHPIRIPEVQLNLIKIDGSPMSQFTTLFKSQDESMQLVDPLYNWILKNINL